MLENKWFSLNNLHKHSDLETYICCGRLFKRLVFSVGGFEISHLSRLTDIRTGFTPDLLVKGVSNLGLTVIAWSTDFLI